MPRSFMITHRRFGEDDLGSITSNSSSNVERRSESSDDRMHPDSPERSYVSCVPDSPEFKKRTVFTCRGFDKSTSVSDGDSDSGCSSQTDVRHELPPELEYTLGCPSGFSLLLELMTQSPQRYSSRDILDLNIHSEINSPGQKLGKEDLEKGRADFDFREIKKPKDYSGSAGNIEVIDNHNMHIYICQENEPSPKTVEHGKYIFEASESRKGYTDCAVSVNDRDYPNCVGKGLYRDTNGVHISSQMTPVYDFHIYGGQEPRMNHIQRRISFDEDLVRIKRVKNVEISESSDDQPIDYSQLSSRRSEHCNEQPCGNKHVNDGQDITCEKEEPKSKARKMSDEMYNTSKKMSDEMYNTSKKMSAGVVATPKYEFILSPKMDGNGNLVLSHSQQFSGRSLQSFQDHKCAVKGNEPSRSLPYIFTAHDNSSGTTNNAQQDSPVTGSPASPLHYNPDMKQETALDIAKAKFEPQKYAQETTGISKAQLTYHPKLKYLLAVSQYTNTKAKQDEDRVLSATAASSCPSYKQSKLFSQDQPAQAEKFMKLNDHDENVYNRIDVGQGQRIPSSELFHTFNNAPNCNHDSVFIFNPSSTFKTCTSPINNSKGSLVNDEQQISDTHSPQISSSPSSSISNSFHGSRTSEQLEYEQAQDESGIIYPASPSQPLSPASLRDQQAALSELLFSTNGKSGVDPYACVDCAKRYSTSSNLARHRQTHRSVCDKKARKCPHCDKVYVSMPAFSMHVRTHNQGCECPHCGKKFSRPWLLQGHIRTHTGEKPFGCPQCGKSFADKSNLRAHIQTHSTEKPYVCGRCGKAFALKSYLYKHEESSCMRGQRFRH